MKKNKFIALLLSTVLLGSLMAGCNKEAPSSSEEVKDAPKVEKVAQEVDASGFKGLADRTPVTLKFFSADLTEDIEFTDPVAQKITELTGVTLEFLRPVGGDTQAIPLMIAGGDYPDLIFAKGDTGMLIDAEAIVPLQDLIEEKGENLKKLYGPMLQRLKYSEEDPTIYTAGAYAINSANWKTDGTMQLQHAVLKELGYPEIRTIEDYEKALRTYKDKYPTINGEPTLGLTLMGSDWRWLITVGNAASAAAGIPDDGEWAIDDSTGTAVYKYFNPEVKEYMKWLNHLNAEGLLDPESFTHKEDAFFAKIASGRVLGMASPEWAYGNPKASLISQGMADRTYAALPVTVNKDIKPVVVKDSGYSGGHGIAITATSKNIDKAFEFLDWMASEEAQILVNWGLEGVNYTVDADGKRVISAEELERKISDKDYKKKTGVGNYIHPFPFIGDGVKDSTGSYYTMNTEQIIIDSMPDAEKETLAAYGKTLWTEFFPTREELGVSKHGQAWQYNIPSDSDLAIFNQKSLDLVQQSITQAILGSPADFDAAWDKILKRLEDMGVKEANDEMTRLTQAKIKFWSN